MEDQEFVDLQISGWWGVATVALVVAGGAMIIAKMIGPEAVEMLLTVSLISVFMIGGVLLGLLAIQALGASQLWGLAETLETAQSPSQAPPPIRKQTVSLVDFSEDLESADNDLNRPDNVDPFYEILKQKRTGRDAA